MPGEARSDALKAAEGLLPGGIGAVFTLLGENVASREGVAAVEREYRALLGEIEGRGLDAQISVKPTQLGLDLDEELAVTAVSGLAVRAREIGSFVWIDMEDSTYREATLRLFRKAVEGGQQNLGLCLQAYLRSTPEDLEGLLPLSPGIRLVKGAYAETEEVAYRRRAEVDEAFFRMGVRLLESGGLAAFATHDMALVERLRVWMASRGPDPGPHEFQMLYGIRVDEQLKLAREGEPVRVLISYGPAWFPWYMRRLAERPANVWFVLKNLFLR